MLSINLYYAYVYFIIYYASHILMEEKERIVNLYFINTSLLIRNH